MTDFAVTDYGAPQPAMYRDLVWGALKEDLGAAGDLTTDAIVPADMAARGRIVARAPGRLAGVPIALEALRMLDPDIVAVVHHDDGADVTPGDVIATVSGRARDLLTGERVALNLLGHLSGVATATRAAVAAVADRGARVADTRKTTPGLRALEKYAVRVGGGANHRFGLGDAVLIKDNHIAVAGGIAPALERARARAGHAVVVEIEVETLAQLDEALAAGAGVILLDNMDPGTLRTAVERVAGRATTEASGGIRVDELAAVAESGVDVVSLGRITHSAPALDVSMEIEPVGGKTVT